MKLLITLSLLLLSMSASPSWGAELVEIAAGTGVEARQLQGRGTGFVAGEGRVFVHLTVASAASETVQLVWKRRALSGEIKTVWTVSLKVGASPRWRTWARRTLRPSDVGEWTVEVLSAEGEVLGSTRFSVTPAVLIPTAGAPRAELMPEGDFGC